MIEWFKEYQEEQARVISTVQTRLVAKLADVMNGKRNSNKNIFICGNGGSASNASHFTVDLGKSASLQVTGPKFKVISLNENVAWMTAIGNDLGYEHIFAEQLKNLGRHDDLLIAVSVSGNSPNVVAAVELANSIGMETFGLTSKDGGEVVKLCKESIIIDSNHYGHVEDAQMFILHMLAYTFVEKNNGQV